MTDKGRKAGWGFGSSLRGLSFGYGLYCLLVVLLLGLLILLVHAYSPGKPVPTTQLPVVRTGDSEMPAFADLVRKGTDLTACRNLVARLNNWLTDHPDQMLKQPGAAEAWQRPFRLDRDELAEAASPTFTPLDGHYLDQTFLFQEAARSLAVDSLPPAERAAVGFHWVVRQVRLREGKDGPVPPHLVLRRGWGTSLERSLVFLALLDQLGVTGCVLGIADAAQPDALQVWLPGAVVGDAVHLFEPRLGARLPFTLAELRQNPDVVDALTVAPTFPYDIPTALARKAEPVGCCPLSALAARMQYLEKQLAPAGPIRLAIDPRQVEEALRKAGGRETRFWPVPTRLLRSFYPPEEGGVDRAGPNRVLRARAYELSLTPWQSLPRALQPIDENTELGQMLLSNFEKQFIAFALDPRGPRDQQVRGRLEQATTELVRALDGLQVYRNRVARQLDLEREVAGWYSDARKAEAEVMGARKTAAKTGEGLAALEAAVKRRNELWKEGDKARLLLIGAAAEPLAAEAGYLLALCKHEQAERSARTAGVDPESVRFAWQTAADRWKKYLEDYPQAPAEAWLCCARALDAAGGRDSATALLKDPPPHLTGWNRHALLYHARLLRGR